MISLKQAHNLIRSDISYRIKKIAFIHNRGRFRAGFVPFLDALRIACRDFGNTRPETPPKFHAILKVSEKCVWFINGAVTLSSLGKLNISIIQAMRRKWILQSRMAPM